MPRTNLSKIIRIILWSAGALCAAGVLIVLILTAAVNLQLFNAKIETAVSDLIRCEFRLHGRVGFLPLPMPTFSFEGISIKNPPGWNDSRLLNIEKLECRVGLVPMLTRTVSIDDIHGEGIEAFLERNPAHQLNWMQVFTSAAPAAKGTKAPPAKAQSSQPPPFRLSLGNLVLKEVRLSYHDVAADKRIDLRSDLITGSAASDKPLTLSVSGTLQQQPIKIQIKAGPLYELLGATAPSQFECDLAIAGIRAHADGTLFPLDAREHLALAVDIQVDGFYGLNRLIGVDIAEERNFRLKGNMLWSEGRLDLSDLAGHLGATRLKGALQLDLMPTPHYLTGHMTVEALDWDLLTSLKKKEDKPGSSPAPKPQTPAGDLFPIGATLAISIPEVVNAPLKLSNISITPKIAPNSLQVRSQATIDGLTVNGLFAMTRADKLWHASLELTSDQAHLERMGQRVWGDKLTRAHAEGLMIKASAKGADAASCLASLDLDISIRQAKMQWYGPTPSADVYGHIENAALTVENGQRMRFTMQGKLAGKPLSAKLKGQSQGGLFSETVLKLDIDVSALDSRWTGHGIVRTGAVPTLERLNYTIQGDHIGELAPLIGISPLRRQAYALRGHVARSNSGYLVGIDNGFIGRSNFTARGGPWPGKGKAIPALHIDCSVLDVDELIHIFEKDEAHSSKTPSPPSDNQQTASKTWSPFKVLDADINVNVLHVKKTRFDDVVITSQIRHSHLQSTAFGATIGPARFEGDLEVDFAREPEEAVLTLKSDHVDVGSTLEYLNLAEGLRMTAQQVRLSLLARKQNPRNWFHDLSLTVDASELSYLLDGTGEIGPETIHVAKAHFFSATGQHSRIELSGDVDDQPVMAVAIIESAQNTQKETSRYPFSLHLQTATTFMDINGHLTLPLKRNLAHLKINLKSDALNQLNPFLGIDLPPVGPYLLSGTLLISPQGHRLSDVALQVGQSRFKGGLDYNTATNPPRFSINLNADLIQLDDFDLGGWSPIDKEAAESETEKGPEDGTSVKRERSGHALISHELVKGLNGKLEVNIREVRSGRDSLGQAQFKATINDGRLEIAPLFLELPGGSVDARFHFSFEPHQVVSSTRISIDQLEYGIVARRKEKDSKAGGLLSLEVALESRAERVGRLMAHANGTFDVSVQPHYIDATVMEYWVTNLIFAILPLVNVGQDSKVNCAAAHMKMADGKMTQERILIDTTRMQVGGKAKLDFKQRTIEAKLKPRPKRAQFLSLATPIDISGKFSDFGPKIRPKHMLGTAIHLVTSAVTVPFHWLIFGKIPPDGKEACRAMLPRSGNELPLSAE